MYSTTYSGNPMLLVLVLTGAVQAKSLMSIWMDEKPESEFSPAIKTAYEKLSAEIPSNLLPVLEVR